MSTLILTSTGSRPRYLRSGALIEAGSIVPVRDRRTRQQRYEDLDDDFQYGSQDVGVRVMSRGQMKTVVETFRDRLFIEIFPERKDIPADKRMVPKTLIFAKNDEHAEEIVQAVRDAFGRGNDFCAKITHKARKPQELLAAFRNSSQLRIAVTVDMIATGTDVKATRVLDLPTGRAELGVFRADEGPWRPHDLSDRVPVGHSRPAGEDPVRHRGRDRRHRKSQGGRRAAGPRPDTTAEPGETAAQSRRRRVHCR